MREGLNRSPYHVKAAAASRAVDFELEAEMRSAAVFEGECREDIYRAAMKCPYCRALNAQDEHRCQRCGRRLGETSHSFTGTRFQHGAAAPALNYGAEEKPEAHAGSTANPTPAGRQEPQTQPRRAVFQRSLFETPRVVQFESFAPESVEAPPRRGSGERGRSRKELAGQESFRFDETVPHPGRAAGGAPSAACGAYVALPAHRMIAAAFDASLVVIAVAVFFVVFHLAGGQIVLNRHTLPLFAGAGSIFYLLYEILWCLAGADTAGMRWAHLRLVDFDGVAPDRDRRLYRVASGWLSVMAAGLGLLWALVDEESLTWHDHISRTFPTPY